ncbi:MAG TPA: ABC transporter ATP-binding protein [Acidimicrobiales bacterium]|nr:ABC transporter ATP-binding protein [Acidimicrobiales bacterium]
MSAGHSHGPAIARDQRRPNALARVWRLAGPRRRHLTLGIAWRVVWAVFMAIAVAQVVVVADEVRRGTLGRDDVVRLVVIYAGCFAGQVTANYWSNRLSWISAFDMGADVRLAAIDRLRRLPLGFHAARDQGDTLTALTQDVVMVETFAHAPLPALVGAFAGPLCVAAVLAAVDVRLAAATLVSVALAVPLYLWANRIFDGLAVRRQDAQAHATGRIVEYLQGIAVIRAYNHSGERLGRFRQSLDDFRAVNTRLAVLILPLAMSAMAVVELGTPLLIGVGAYGVVGGTVDAGTLVVFLVLALRVYQPLVHSADQLEQLRLADASLQRLARVLDEPEQVVPADAVAQPADASVRLEAVVFGYDSTGAEVSSGHSHGHGHGRRVLDGVDLEVPAGTTCAIVGPSGAGKSTLLNLVARFWDPDAGSVRLGGVDLRDLTAEQLYDAVTVVFQDVYLFDGTVYDNIAFGRSGATHDEVVAAATAAQAHDFVTALPQGYDTPVGEGGTLLSGGERQRISIARAILKDAAVVLLDEATAALDPTTERAVQTATTALVRDKTLLVVAHRLSTIQHADQIVVMDHGRIVERGGHHEVLAADGLYARLWADRSRATNWRLRSAHPVP